MDINAFPRLVDHTTSYLCDLVKAAGNGELALPKFQRPFVWDDSDTSALLDSITQGFPIGSLILWVGWWSGAQVPADRVRPFEGSTLRPNPTLVLDGQQRLTALLNATRHGTRWVVDLGGEAPVFRLGTDAELADRKAAMMSAVFPAWTLMHPHEVDEEFNEERHSVRKWATPVEYEDVPVTKTVRRKGVLVKVSDGTKRVTRDLPQTAHQKAVEEAMHNIEALRTLFRSARVSVTAIDPRATLDYAREVFRRFNCTGRPMSQSDVFDALSGG